jgi:hypothetical protein
MCHYQYVHPCILFCWIDIATNVLFTTCIYDYAILYIDVAPSLTGMPNTMVYILYSRQHFITCHPLDEG